MPIPCTVCVHPGRAEIDSALVSGTSNRNVAERYGLKTTSVFRHRTSHIPKALTEARDVERQVRADDLLQQLFDLKAETLEILEQARSRDDHELALKAIARLEKQIELQARLLGELRDGVTINLYQSAEWFAVVTKLLAALDPYPDVKLIVAEVLERADR
jgi:hypothetical protein